MNSESIPPRKRFSAAHELGHWMRDAGKISLGCNPESQPGSGDFSAETRANAYASDLLLPKFMFAPRAEKRPTTIRSRSANGLVEATWMRPSAISCSTS
ncbi:MAG: ImmA/IrrE family metallo-endopeptidase [Vicinamibacterales bacterium]